MTWILWVVVALLAFGTVVSITQVGKPREPVTPGVAATTVVIQGLIISAIIFVGILN